MLTSQTDNLPNSVLYCTLYSLLLVLIWLWAFTLSLFVRDIKLCFDTALIRSFLWVHYLWLWNVSGLRPSDVISDHYDFINNIGCQFAVSWANIAADRGNPAPMRSGPANQRPELGAVTNQRPGMTPPPWAIWHSQQEPINPKSGLICLVSALLQHISIQFST